MTYLQRGRMGLWGVGALALVAACMMAIALLGGGAYREDGTELLLKVHLSAHEPYSPPSNMYLWWGDTTNHRFVGSGEHIRHLLHLGNIEGGEWRDPMFLGNNGVATFRSQRFRRISESCCSTIVMPPFEWDFPVYNTHKIIGQRLRNYVANGNMLILTGGIMATEFINTYFFYNIELADGNYSPGPFRRLPGVPTPMKDTPRVLPQKGISVTAVKKESLPSGTQVLFGTPRSSAVYMIKFCEAQSPMDGMPPVKVLPRDCPASKRAGRPCSCGNIMYIGYNFEEPYPTRYDHVLRAAVEILNPSSEGSKKSITSQSLLSVNDAAEDEHEGAIEREEMSAHSAHAGDDQSVDQKLAMQKLEIHHLQGMLSTLDTERKAVHKFTEKKEIASKGGDADVRTPALSEVKKHAGEISNDGARTSSLAELKSRAAKLIGQIRDAEVHKKEVARQMATGRGVGRERGAQKLLLQSVAALAQDVKREDARVDMLAERESDDSGRSSDRDQDGRRDDDDSDSDGERHGARRERGRREDDDSQGRRSDRRGRDEGRGASQHDSGDDDEREKSGDGQAAEDPRRASRKRRAGDERRDEKREESRGKSEKDTKVAQQLALYKKKAAAYKKELAFEQSVPTPSYSYEEADHTQPFFGNGQHQSLSQSSTRCGTLCKLKELVKKTRFTISKELSNAMKA